MANGSTFSSGVTNLFNPQSFPSEQISGLDSLINELQGIKDTISGVSEEDTTKKVETPQVATEEKKEEVANLKFLLAVPEKAKSDDELLTAARQQAEAEGGSARTIMFKTRRLYERALGDKTRRIEGQRRRDAFAKRKKERGVKTDEYGRARGGGRGSMFPSTMSVAEIQDALRKPEEELEQIVETPETAPVPVTPAPQEDLVRRQLIEDAQDNGLSTEEIADLVSEYDRKNIDEQIEMMNRRMELTRLSNANREELFLRNEERDPELAAINKALREENIGKDVGLLERIASPAKGFLQGAAEGAVDYAQEMVLPTLLFLLTKNPTYLVSPGAKVTKATTKLTKLLPNKQRQLSKGAIITPPPVRKALPNNRPPITVPPGGFKSPSPAKGASGKQGEFNFASGKPTKETWRKKTKDDKPGMKFNPDDALTTPLTPLEIGRRKNLLDKFLRGEKGLRGAELEKVTALFDPRSKALSLKNMSTTDLNVLKGKFSRTLKIKQSQLPGIAKTDAKPNMRSIKELNLFIKKLTDEIKRRGDDDISALINKI